MKKRLIILALFAAASLFAQDDFPVRTLLPSGDPAIDGLRISGTPTRIKGSPNSPGTIELIPGTGSSPRIVRIDGQTVNETVDLEIVAGDDVDDLVRISLLNDSRNDGWRLVFDQGTVSDVFRIQDHNANDAIIISQTTLDTSFLTLANITNDHILLAGDNVDDLVRIRMLNLAGTDGWQIVFDQSTVSDVFIIQDHNANTALIIDQTNLDTSFLTLPGVLNSLGLLAGNSVDDDVRILMESSDGLNGFQIYWDQSIDDLRIELHDGTDLMTLNSAGITMHVPCTGCGASGFTEGSVIFSDSGGNLTEDNANFFWHAVNEQLLIGATSPVDSNSRLEIIGKNAGVIDLFIQEEGVTVSHRAEIQLRTYASGGEPINVIRGYHARGTAASPTAPLSGDRGWFMGANPHDGVSFPTNSSAAIFMRASENISATNLGYGIDLAATDIGSTTRTTRFTIADDITIRDDVIADAHNTYSLFTTGVRPAKIWTVDLDVSGVCTNCAGLPVLDTTSIVKGSVDPTKEIRFEVDGLTTGTIRTLTVQNSNYVLAGLDVIAQIFTVTQTFNGNIIPNGTTQDAGTLASPWDDLNFDGEIAGGGTVGMNWLPDADNSRSLGSGTLGWTTVFITGLELEDASDNTIVELNNTTGSATQIRLIDPGGTRRMNIGFFGAGDNDAAVSLLGPLTADNIAITTADVAGTPALQIGNISVVKSQCSALPTDATDLATAITLVNAIKDCINVNGHGLAAGT